MPPGREWMYGLQGGDASAGAQAPEEFVIVLTPSGYEVRSADLAKFNGEGVIQGGFTSPDQAQAAAQELTNQRGGASAQAPRYQIQGNLEAGRGDLSGFDNVPVGLPGGDPNAQMGQDWTQTLQNYRMGMPNQERNQAELLRELESPTNFGARSVFDYGSPGLGGATVNPQTGAPQRIGEQPSADGSMPTSPVDPYTDDIFGGTWAEGRTTNPILTNIIAGNMTPDAAVMNVLDAAGASGYGNRDLLENSYADFGNIYSMSNPGETALDPAMYYGMAGDHVMGLVDRNDELQFLDAPALWDNQFSDAYTQQAQSLAEGQDNPAELERDMILSNIAALSPYMGNQQTSFLANNVDREYNRYIASGLNMDMSFVQYLRSIGADDWM